MKSYDGTKNGKIIKWFDSNGRVVFEWNENLNGANGPHYHFLDSETKIRIPGPTGDTHIYPGETMIWP